MNGLSRVPNIGHKNIFAIVNITKLIIPKQNPKNQIIIYTNLKFIFIKKIYNMQFAKNYYEIL